MRDTKRIPMFLRNFSVCWLCFPDLRFGQFVSNVFSYIKNEYGLDPFFIEDDEMEEYIHEYCEKISKN